MVMGMYIYIYVYISIYIYMYIYKSYCLYQPYLWILNGGHRVPSCSLVWSLVPSLIRNPCLLNYVGHIDCSSNGSEFLLEVAPSKDPSIATQKYPRGPFKGL